MRGSTIILALWLSASAWAQTPPKQPQAHPPAQVKPGTMVKTPTPQPTAVKPAVLQTGKPASQLPPTKPPVANASVKPVVAPVQSAAKKPATTAPKKAKKPSAAQPKVARRKVVHTPDPTALAIRKVAAPKPVGSVIRGRRDPFVSPIVERTNTGFSCIGSGRKCLAVGDITLHGVVSSPSGLIAVVVNGNRTYFLREHDPLANGAVERITRDAIVLRERSSDALGRPFTREVTKKIGVPAA